MQTMNRPNARFLMCRPDHFAVSYTINPWMDPKSWTRDERAPTGPQQIVDLGGAFERAFDVARSLVVRAPGLTNVLDGRDRLRTGVGALELHDVSRQRI